jgi:site-specific DNA-methyltransferase (adenine-specific)
MQTIKNLQNIPICGNCLEVMNEIPDKSIDMILCDLPYGTTACKWDTIIPFDLLWSQYKRIVKDKGVIALFGSEPFSSYLRLSNIDWFKYDWIWDKVRPSGFQIAKYVPMKRHEIISIFSNGSKWYPQKEKRDKPVKGRVCSSSDSSPLKYNDGLVREYSDKNPQSILVFSKQSDGKYLHPTQKPQSLCEYLIKTYSLEDELILDNCAGSFTTAVSCDNTRRNWICIEKEDNYCQIGLERINNNRIILNLPIINDYKCYALETFF